MTTLSIIEVDLDGLDVEQIIANDMAELTGEAKKAIDRVIEETAQERAEQLQKKEKADAKTAAIDAAMDQAHNQILQAGNDGVLCADIIKIVEGVVPNSSAFTLRMKKRLRDQGGTHTINRRKRNGQPHYVLEPIG